MFFKRQPVHFVGIGGIGMSGLAEVLLELGYPVTGSDLKPTPITDRLAARGAVIFEGHAAANLGGAKAVVVSSAVRADNPELLEARRRNLPVIPRGELLAELMRQKFGIAVAGSHGKTTTTSMIAAVLSHANLDPTIVVGGRVGMMGGANARLGRSDYLVVESDESDGSFLKLAPILAVVTNIDREHLDHYTGIEEIRRAFADFIGKVPFYGAAILCLDDENIQRILPSLNRRVITYGASAQADVRVTHSNTGHMASEFHLIAGDRDLGCFRLPIPGAHNILNAAAAVAIGLELEIPLETIREALAGFSGVDRRFQVKGTVRGITVVDDYGHHPTEIRATLGRPSLQISQCARVISAAPLHPDASPARRFRARVPSGGYRVCDRHLRRLGAPDRGCYLRGACGKASRLTDIAVRTMPGRSNRAWRRFSRRRLPETSS